MKKIFAIALALVMVLSMASAFASPCMGGFDWTSASVTNCGKAKVEVVPYVKVSNGCGGYNWQVSECAGAVKGEHVYFALKLTVDANLDAEWWNKADMTITTTGLSSPVWTKGAVPETGLTATTATSDKEAVWYFDFTNDTWFKVGTEAGNISVADDVEAATSLFIKQGVVDDSSKAKVCVKLASTGNDFTAGVVGKYYVEYRNNTMYVWNNDDRTELLATYGTLNGEVNSVTYTAKSCAPYDMASIKAFFGIDEGTKLTQKLVNKNFGWDDTQEDCFKFNATTAIVDAECVVAIPKTGDASVLAWLF